MNEKYPADRSYDAALEEIAVRNVPEDDDDSRERIRREISWGATPLTTFGRPDIARRQGIVQLILLQRIHDALITAPAIIRDFAELNFMSRFEMRLDRNRQSYNRRLIREIPYELSEMHDRVLPGAGSAYDALMLQSGLQMPSIEVARLTHPNVPADENTELDGMKAEVNEAVIALGGAFHEETDSEYATEYKLNNLDTIVPQARGVSSQQAGLRVQAGLMATAKRHIATMPDGTKLFQRSSYIINLDSASDFDQQLADAMRGVDISRKPNPLRAIAKAGRLDTLLPELIENQGAHNCVIPMSTTIYAYNESIDQAAAAQEAFLQETCDDGVVDMDAFNMALTHDKLLQTKLADAWDKRHPEQRDGSPSSRSTLGGHIIAHLLSSKSHID